MKYLALDTNIYLDMVVSRIKGHNPEAYEQMRKLLDYGEIKLVVPSIVTREVDRHVNNEIEKINSHLKLIKKNVETLYWINNVEEMKVFKAKIPTVKTDVKALQRLFESNKEKYISDAEKIFSDLFSHEHVIVLEETPEILFKAQLRQLYKKRPFHYNQQEKDSLADAVLIESLIDFTNNSISSDEHLYFISRNTKDFSSDDANEKLHPEINESILSVNIESQFHYRNLFYKTLLDDFKDETEHAGFLDELEAQRELEDFIELEEIEQLEIEHHRELGGLTSLLADWEEIISEHGDSDNFLRELFMCHEELIDQFNDLSNEYFSLKNQIKQLNLENIQQVIRCFNNSDNEHLEITEDLVEMQEAIIELIDERISIDIEAYESSEMWKCEDYFSLNNTLLKFEDFNNNVLTVEIVGELNPENEGTDLIDVIVNNNILNQNIKGYIEVCYGYMSFDEENHPANSMQEEINFYLDEVIETVQEVTQHLKNQIQHNKEIMIDTINKLGI